MKKILLLFFLSCIIAPFSIQAAAAKQPQLKVNEQPVYLDGCIIKDGRVYLASGSFSGIDSMIVPIQENGQITLIYNHDNSLLTFTPGSSTFVRTAEVTETMSCNEPFYDGQTGNYYIPLADAARALGYFVKWENGTVHILSDPALIERFERLDFPLENALFQFMPDTQDYVFSPLSLKYALALLANGIDDDSSAEILDLLQHESLADMNQYLKAVMEHANDFEYKSGYQIDMEKGRYEPVENIKVGTQLDIYNSLWLEQAAFIGEEAVWHPDYLETVQQYLNGEVYILYEGDDYGQIDRWVADKTKGLVQSAGVRPNFYALLMNAVYFEATWQDTFREAATEPDEFTQKDGTKTTMDFMHEYVSHGQNQTLAQDGTRLKWTNYVENDFGQIYSKPYVQNHLNMVFVLPKDENWHHSAINLNSIVQSLYLNKIDDPAYGIDYFTVIDVKIPKFTVSYDGAEQFEKALKSVGVHKIFETTDYSNMLQQGEFPRDDWDISQQTKLLIDETGTKAASITTFAPAGSSGEQIEIRYIDFHLNRPFIYLVYDHKYDEILFAGALYNTGQ